MAWFGCCLGGAFKGRSYQGGSDQMVVVAGQKSVEPARCCIALDVHSDLLFEARVAPM